MSGAVVEMSSCGHCGDRYPGTSVHNCWALAKVWSQADAPSDLAPLGRPVESDADWYTNHGNGD